ncbi:YlbL family protein [Sporichthya polymorpha]|uniref:YlbL family protein n=1 Tax=Sporichthya polymorpha TaxID=35751 RepID=UPI00035E3C7E|nr:PDZ domain-containing protein [Sporichthya polymorpha]
MLNRLGARQARNVTLSVTGVLLAVMVACLLLLPVPYARLSPGPATDTLGEANGKPLIVISGRQTFPTTGKLDLTTVAISNPSHRMSLFEAMQGWLQSGVAVVPRNTVYPDNLSAEDIEARNVQEMALSQTHATAAALKQLKIPLVGNTVVAALTEGTPAWGKLQVADRILRIDGVKVTGPAQVVELVRKHKPGEQVAFVLERDGKRVNQTLTAAANPDDPSIPFVGITPDVDYEFPFSVTISLDDVGGPSAGLMFALGIVERLTPEDITGGRHIAGTGSISDDGVVGKIGGIQMKILGARKAGATVFMVPAGNCREAAANRPDGIQLVRVDTLDTAVKALTAIRTGQGTVPTC